MPWVARAESVTYTSRGRSFLIATDITRRCQEQDPRDRIHHDICWEAVIRILRENGIVSKSHYEDLCTTTSYDYDVLFPDYCYLALTYDDYLNIPRGSLVGFFKRDRDGELYLAHAAIALGNGYVAGINGGGVGLPNYLARGIISGPVGWNPTPATSFYAGDRERDAVQVRYRDIDDFSSPCAIM